MASAHLRQATELLIARTDNEQAETSAEVAAWGILTLATCVSELPKSNDSSGLTLNSTWSGLVYQKPNAPVSPHALVFRDVPIERVGALSQSRRRSQSEGDAARTDYNLKSAYEQAKLYRIVHEILLSYCGSRGNVSGSQMISIYERLLDWKEGLPTKEPDPDSEEEAPPHLLFLQ